MSLISKTSVLLFLFCLGLTLFFPTAAFDILAQDIVTTQPDKSETADQDPDEMRRYEKHGGAVYALAMDQKGDRLATAGEDRIIHVWDPNTGELLHTLTGHQGPIFSLAFFPDGKKLVSTSLDRTVRIWNVDDAEVLHVLEHHQVTVRRVAINQDGTQLVTGDDYGRLIVWRIGKGRPIGRIKAHRGPVYALQFSRNGQYLLSAGRDNRVKMWHVREGKQVGSLKFESPIRDIAIRGKENEAVLADLSGQLHFIETIPEKVKLLSSVNSPIQSLQTVVFNPDGKLMIYAGGGQRGGGSSINMHASGVPGVFKQYQGTKAMVSRILMDNKGRFFVVAGVDGSVVQYQIPENLDELIKARLEQMATDAETHEEVEPESDDQAP